MNRATNQGKDRRRKQRFDCDGHVEINRLPSTGKRKGKLRDLSEIGCYIEMEQPFPSPSYVEILLHTPAMRLRLTGVIRRTLKNGVGVEFDVLSARGRLLLLELMAELEQDCSQHAVQPGPSTGS